MNEQVQPEAVVSVAEFWGTIIGGACELTWQYRCPECEACFETHYDAGDTEVACEHCSWKGKAGT